MPVTEVSGLAGTVGAYPESDALQNFADHFMRAKEQKRQDAMQQLEFMMKMTTQSGGRFVPDAGEMEKLSKAAGLPKMTTSGGGGQGGQSGGMGDMFKGLAEHSKVMAGADEAKAQASKAQSELDEFTTKMEKTASDSESDDNAKARATSALVMLNKRTLAQALDADVLSHLKPEQRDRMIASREDELMGKRSDKENQDAIDKLFPQLLEDYDGNTTKASAAATAIVNRQPLGPDLQPPMTDQSLKRDITIAQHGVELGWTPTMISQAQAARTTDTSKLSSLYGWNKDTVDKLTPLKVREVQDKERQTGAYERMASAEERRATSEEKRTDIAAEQARTEGIERVARAWKELAQAGNTKDPEMKALTTQIENLRRLQTMKAPIPPDALKSVTDQLMKSLVDENGAPLMHEGDVSTFLGLGSSKGWVLGGPADPELTKKQTPAGTPEKSLTDPDVLKEFMNRFPGDAEKFMDSIPGGIDKFGAWLDDFLAGGHATRGASGKF